MNKNFSKYFFAFSLALFTLLLPIFSIASTGEKAKQVVLVRYNLKVDTPSAIIDKFKKTMAERGYIEGKNIDYIDFVTQDPEHKAADQVLDIINKYKPTADIFITSSWTSLYVRSILAKSKTPQLFSPALESTVLNMLASTDAEPGTNLSGVYLQFPPEKLLQLTRLVLPQIRKYAFVYDSRIPADIVFKAAFGQLTLHERQGITIYYLDLANGIDTVLQKINKMGIEAFGGSVGVLQNLKNLSRINLPIITALLIDRNQESLIKVIKNTSIVGGLYNSFDSCGKQIAEMTADIFEDKVKIEEIIPRPAPQLSVVNLVAAKRLNQFIPVSALEDADIVIK